jgi:hypothetical protein
MKALPWCLPSVLLVFSFSAFAAGGAVGNGGDGVFCKPSPGNPFQGYYSLDYLAQFNPAIPLAEAQSLDQSLDRIEKTLRAELPELAASFKVFRDEIFNETDFTKTHIWDRANFGLIDLKDEMLVNKVPENCRNGDQVQIVQAVIRLNKEVSGLPGDKINYKYVPEVVNELRKKNGLQLSFLLVHEWLWSFSSSVERNRRINYWLHADNGWTRQKWIDQLHGIGFTVPQMEPPVWEPSICETAPDAVETFLGYSGHLPWNSKVFSGNGQGFKRTIRCPKATGCAGQSYRDATADFRREFGDVIVVDGVVEGYTVDLLLSRPYAGQSPGVGDLFSRCWIESARESSGCDWFAPSSSGFQFKDMLPAIGNACLSYRGARIIDRGEYNEIEEIVIYAPAYTWLR